MQADTKRSAQPPETDWRPGFLMDDPVAARRTLEADIGWHLGEAASDAPLGGLWALLAAYAKHRLLLVMGERNPLSEAGHREGARIYANVKHRVDRWIAAVGEAQAGTNAGSLSRASAAGDIDRRFLDSPRRFLASLRAGAVAPAQPEADGESAPCQQLKDIVRGVKGEWVRSAVLRGPPYFLTNPPKFIGEVMSTDAGRAEFETRKEGRDLFIRVRAIDQ